MSTKLPRYSGIVPVMPPLLFKNNTRNFSMASHSSGIVPLSSFRSNRRKRSRSISPISDGRLPKNPLLSKNKICSSSKLANLELSVPDKSLESKSMMVRRSASKISSGIDPVSSLESKSRVTNFSRRPNVEGMVPTKKFNPSSNSPSKSRSSICSMNPISFGRIPLKLFSSMEIPETRSLLQLIPNQKQTSLDDKNRCSSPPIHGDGLAAESALQFDHWSPSVAKYKTARMYRCWTSRKSSGQTWAASSSISHLKARFCGVPGMETLLPL
mmetsp:Transcript_132/g.294  ORF Transcript_132/g.294 Transcript_132/m.294 type:complete len:270 (+) Transcript_132:620-1429(+)